MNKKDTYSSEINKINDKENNDIKIKALVFDQDGVLFDTEQIVQKSWTFAGRRLGYGDLGQEIYHTIGLSREGRKEYFLNLLDSDFPFEEFAKLSKVFFNQWIDENGLPLKPGLREIMDWLKGKNIPLAVATSSSKEYVEANLKNAGIASYFQAVISKDMVKKAKPDPEIYQKACDALKLDPSVTAAIEDAPNGILSAYYAGLYPIMIPDLCQTPDQIKPLLLTEAESLFKLQEFLIPYLEG